MIKIIIYILKPMSIKDYNKNSGFTLIEMLIVTSVGIIISMLLLYIITSGFKYIRQIEQKKILQTNISFLSDKFAYWIRQGEELELASSSESELKVYIKMSDDSMVVKVFKQQENKIKFGDFGSTYESLLSQGVVVDSFSIIHLARSIQINSTLKLNDEKLSFKTTLAQRN